MSTAILSLSIKKEKISMAHVYCQLHTRAVSGKMPNMRPSCVDNSQTELRERRIVANRVYNLQTETMVHFKSERVNAQLFSLYRCFKQSGYCHSNKQNDYDRLLKFVQICAVRLNRAPLRHIERFFADDERASFSSRVSHLARGLAVGQKDVISFR